MSGAFGLDFGTTNSALSVFNGSRVVVVDIDKFNAFGKTMRSVIFFNNEGSVCVGQEAIDRYMESGGEGRFMQSIKSFLPNTLFEYTTIKRKQYELEDLIAILLGSIRQRGEEAVGEAVERAVMGRPVVFSENKERDALAEARLLRAAERAGFKEIAFQLEPIAASLAYESALSIGEEKIVLVGDFGGGTSDFCVVRLRGGAGSDTDRRPDILSLGGIYVAGDVFDSELMWERVAKYFGKEVMHKGMRGQLLEMPTAITFKLKNWHLIPQLRDRKIREMIREIKHSADKPELIDNLEHLVEDNYGFMLFQAIERAKIKLSSEGNARISFRERQLVVEEGVARSEFESYIAEHVRNIGSCIDETVAKAGLNPQDIDIVLITGGTSFVPCIKQAFVSRFGHKKLKQIDAFTSVAHGLGIHASRIFR